MAPAPIKPAHGFEFRFYSKDRGEPPHVHVYRNGVKIKFWLGPPVALADTPDSKSLRGFKRQELRRARQLVEAYREAILEGWRTFFEEN